MDLLELLYQFGQTGDDLTADLDGSGSVGVSDLLALLINFGGNIEDFIPVPPLDLDAWVQSIENVYSYNTGQEFDFDAAATYYEILIQTSPTSWSILQSQYPEIYEFVEGNQDNFIQIYLTDDSGNFIPQTG